MKHEGWTDLAGSLGISLTNEQEAQLERYEQLLRDRALAAGMVASNDAARLRERHLLDSLRAATLVRAEDATAYDLGSGAGLPGIVVAIACPELVVRLVEPRRSRAAFLELAVDEISLGNVRVLIDRAEDLEDRAEVCFCRAFGDIRKAWTAAERLLTPGGRLVYFAGSGFDATSAPAGVTLEIQTFPSLARAGSLVIMTRQ